MTRGSKTTAARGSAQAFPMIAARPALCGVKASKRLMSTSNKRSRADPPASLPAFSPVFLMAIGVAVSASTCSSTRLTKPRTIEAFDGNAAWT